MAANQLASLLLILVLVTSIHTFTISKYHLGARIDEMRFEHKSSLASLYMADDYLLRVSVEGI
jgi:hypothetical protein